MGEITRSCLECSERERDMQQTHYAREILLRAGYRYVEHRRAYSRETIVPGLIWWVNPPGRWEDECRLNIWTSPSAGRSFPDWLTNRHVKQEAARLLELGLVVGYTYVDSEYDAEDGYCRICGNDFGAPGAFCSPACESRALELREAELRKAYAIMLNHAPPCAGGCGRKLLLRMDDVREARRLLNVDISYTHHHHTNYSEDTTVLLCTGCHNVVTHDPDAPPHLAALRPEMKLAEHERKKRERAAARRRQREEKKAREALELQARAAADALVREAAARALARSSIPPSRWAPRPQRKARSLSSL